MSELLSQILSPLDMPRQAAWNAVRAGGNALTGNGTWDDALRAVPGLLGAGLAGGLMATGVGAPLGILAGSLLGGVGQGLGKAVDSERFRAPEVSDLTGTDEFLPNALVGALTDPLTYAGAGLGAQRARGVFTKLGPNYAGGAEKIASAALANEGESAHLVKRLLGSPSAEKILAEIPPGSTFMPGGSNALPFRTPQGDVIRIATEGKGALPQSRAAIPEMLQPTRNVPIGDYRVERVPFADRVGDRELYKEAYQPLGDSIRNQGFYPSDLHPGNIGEYRGKPVLIDPGAVDPHMSAFGPMPLAPDMLGNTPWKYLFPNAGAGVALTQAPQLPVRR